MSSSVSTLNGVASLTCYNALNEARPLTCFKSEYWQCLTDASGRSSCGGLSSSGIDSCTNSFCNNVTKGGCWNAVTGKLSTLVSGAKYCQTTLNTSVTVESTDCTPDSNTICCKIVSMQACNRVSHCYNPNALSTIPCDCSGPGKDFLCAVKFSDNVGSCVNKITYDGLNQSDYIFFNQPFGSVSCWNPQTQSSIKCPSGFFICKTDLKTRIGSCYGAGLLPPSTKTEYYCYPKTEWPFGCNNFGPVSVPMESNQTGAAFTCYDPKTPATPVSCAQTDVGCVTSYTTNKDRYLL
jgi:hypothetical protein